MLRNARARVCDSRREDTRAGASGVAGERAWKRGERVVDTGDGETSRPGGPGGDPGVEWSEQRRKSGRRRGDGAAAEQRQEVAFVSFLIRGDHLVDRGLRSTRIFFNRAFVSTRSSLHVRVASLPSSHRAGIPENLDDRRVVPFSDVSSGCHRY